LVPKHGSLAGVVDVAEERTTSKGTGWFEILE
jgi:hypothetical protein